MNLTMLFAGVVLKLVPVMVTVVPSGAVTGVKSEIVGGKRTVKSVDDTEVTLLTSTDILPDVAPFGTVATMLVAVADVMVAVTLLNFTVFSETVELKLVPVMVIVAPTPAATGAKEVMVEGNNTVKSLAEVACPDDVVTEIFPVVAPAGTDTVKVVGVAAVTVVAVPLKVTMLFPVFAEKCSPVMLTVVLSNPFSGVKEVIVGGGSTSSSLHELSFNRLKSKPQTANGNRNLLNFIHASYLFS